MNATTQQFEHTLAEGYGLSADDTHQRYADEFKSAELQRALDISARPVSGKASLYALIMAMWGAIIFALIMAIAFGG
jgi:hypothetical protein